MRFLVMVFLSLFLMTNVSVAKPINCPDLKKKIEDHYRFGEADRSLAKVWMKKNLNLEPLALAKIKNANIHLDKAAKYAAIYSALCK